MEPNRVLSIDDDINELITDWKLDQKNVSILLEEIRKMVKNSGIDTSPLYDMIQQMIDEKKSEAPIRTLDLRLIPLRTWNQWNYSRKMFRKGKWRTI